MHVSCTCHMPHAMIILLHVDVLEELCMDHGEDRRSVLLAFKQRLSVELGELEKEVVKMNASEGEVTAFLRKKIKDLSKSRQIQQSQ